jgi:hypothetical protein
MQAVLDESDPHETIERIKTYTNACLEAESDAFDQNRHQRASIFRQL